MYRPDGRLRGAFVYMLLCRDDGPIYAKVGISCNPYQRLMSLRLGCPVKPRRFCSFEVHSRRKAQIVESDLHRALSKWAAHGEWFKVSLDEKREFNDALKPVLARHDEPAWPCEWNQVAVQNIVEYGERRKRYVQRQWRMRGPAYQDFMRESAA